MNSFVVVTRHAALVDYLVEQGLVPAGTPIVSHATPDDVRGKHVIGVLPLRLASVANMVTEVPLNIPVELRGVELSIEQVRQFAGTPATYKVAKL